MGFVLFVRTRFYSFFTSSTCLIMALLFLSLPDHTEYITQAQDDGKFFASDNILAMGTDIRLIAGL